ncbi:MAG TPA: hypothetical protein VHL11_25830, partial [Phototrophicaceae bacterium]|nr:hypothetical protein [Phototrophicaceae bacterium]
MTGSGWLTPSQDKRCSAEEALSIVQSGNRVFLSGNCSVPHVLRDALIERARTLTDVEVTQVLTIDATGFVAPEMRGHIRVNSLFISDDVREAVNAGNADFTPIFLSEVPELFRTRLPLDVALIQVSPPDEHGFCSYGIEVGVTKTAAEVAKVVIAEVNPRMPRTLGDSFIHVSRLTRMVEVDYALPEVYMGLPSPVQTTIAQQVAGLIEDGSTLQTGIGGIPDAVLGALTQHRHLGIHTELFSDGVIDLVERGIITNEAKTLHPGKIIAGFILGTDRLYDFVH